MTNPLLSIVTPALNEEENLSALLEDLIEVKQKNRLDCEIIVVDDLSTDDTGKIADHFSKKYSFIRAIHRQSEKHGMGLALNEGTEKAKGEIICWIMADRSDELNLIPRMMQLIQGGKDIVLASRYMPGGSKGDLPANKALLGKIYTFLCRMLFGIKVHDMTNAFRMFRQDVFKSIRTEKPNFAISPEFAIKAQINKFRFVEIPTTYSNRKVGKAKFKVLQMALEYASLFKYRLIKP